MHAQISATFAITVATGRADGAGVSVAATAAGAVSTAIFVLSYLPMLVKAGRTKDLSSYSLANLVLASIGNVLYTWYVLSLPIGPIYLLHAFYLSSTALMLIWYLRYGVRRRARTEPEVVVPLPEVVSADRA